MNLMFNLLLLNICLSLKLEGYNNIHHYIYYCCYYYFKSLMEKNILRKEEFDPHTSFFEDWRFHDTPEISTNIYIKNLMIDEIFLSFSYHPSFIS